jgi:biotin transporter BioY
MQNKQKRKVSNIMLVLICVMIILYTVANFILQYFTTVEVSPTLTTAWFAFWGTEIIALTAIKTSKVKHGKDGSAEPFEEASAEQVDISSEEIAG